jgi:hypothetical protein
MRCPIETGEGELLLEPVRSSSLGDHIRGCHACGEFLAAQKALDLWEAPPVSADFDRRLYQRIEQEVPWWDFLVRPFRPLAGPRWLPVAAAAGLMIAVGLWVEHPGETPMRVPASAQVQALPADQAADALQEMQVMQEFSNLIHSDAEPRM